MFDSRNPEIRYKLYLSVSKAEVYDVINSDKGREKFWVEKSKREGDIITMSFIGYEDQKCEVIKEIKDSSIA